MVFDQAPEGAQVMHTRHVHLRGTVLRAQKQRLHDAERLVEDRHAAEHLRARAHSAVAAHVAFRFLPWTARELAASAAPTVHARAIYTEVVVVAVHLDEVPERVGLAHEVARVAMSTDGLSRILHAHVALGSRVNWSSGVSRRV